MQCCLYCLQHAPTRCQPPFSAALTQADVYVLVSNIPGLLLAGFMTFSCYGFAEERVRQVVVQQPGQGLAAGGAAARTGAGSSRVAMTTAAAAAALAVHPCCCLLHCSRHRQVRDTMLLGVLAFASLLAATGGFISFARLEPAAAANIWCVSPPGACQQSCMSLQLRGQTRHPR